jgi:hypothetical protein
VILEVKTEIPCHEFATQDQRSQAVVENVGLGKLSAKPLWGGLLWSIAQNGRK